MRVEQGITRNASLLIFITRCLLTPLAGPVSLLAGAARIAVPRYLVWELAGTALYFCGYLALGRLLGPALLRDTQSCPLLRHHRGGDRPAVSAAVAVCWLGPPCEPSRVTRHGSDGI